MDKKPNKYINDEETIDAKSRYHYKGKGGMGSVLDFKILQKPTVLKTFHERSINDTVHNLFEL